MNLLNIGTILYSEAAEETSESILGNTVLDSILESSNDLSELTSFLIDVMYILVVAVIALAALTLLAYMWRGISHLRDKDYVKNDDDFLDN